MQQQAGASIRLLTTAEAAEILRRSPRTLERWRVTGEGPPYIRALGRALYDAQDLEAWIREHRRISTSDTGTAA